MKNMMSVYLKPYAGRIVLELCIKLTSTLGELALPVILSYIIDTVILEQNRSRIAAWGLVMLGCAALSCAAHIMTNRMSAAISGEAAERIRNDVFGRICWMSDRQREELTVSSLVSRITSDSYILYDTMVYMQRTGVRAPVMLTGAAVFMMAMDPMMAVLVLLVTILVICVAWKAAGRCMPMYQELQKRNDAVWGKIRETIQGIRVIKAFSTEEEELGRFRKINEAAAAQEQKAGMAMAVVSPILNVSFQLCIVLLLLVGSLRIYKGLLLPGKMIAFLTYVSLILTALLNVSKVLVLFSKASASADRIMEVLQLPLDPVIVQEEEPVSSCLLEFDHVSFSYHDCRSGERTLEDISFRLEKGEWLGIVGGTGSGKSTVLQLMMRYADAQEGCVRLCGRDIRSISPNQVHRWFAPVFQYDYICSGTLADNICFGRNMSEEAVGQAAEDAQAMEFIQTRKEGLSARTEAGGRNLSGGQKQRLLVARALAGMKAPPKVVEMAENEGVPEYDRILVFDDSFSALDYQTDRLLRHALKEKYGGCTAVIVSQRISSIMETDRILVLEAGRAVGFGTHRSLLEECPVYKEIWQSGAEEAREEKNCET